MKKFNPENKSKLTYGEIFDWANSISDPDEAQEFLNDYTDYIVPFLKEEKIKLLEMGGNIDVNKMLKSQAIEIAKSNLGYFAGYYDDDTRRKIEKLFLCSHPIFGSIEKNGAPTSEEAFNAGFNGKILEEIRENNP